MPPPELFSESPDGKPCNLITRENYEYLRDSFFRYASLMKRKRYMHRDSQWRKE